MGTTQPAGESFYVVEIKPVPVPNFKLRVQRMVELSTAHLSKREADAPVENWPVRACKDDYGFMAYVADGEDSILASMSDEAAEAEWPGLLAICRWAKKFGAVWVLIDSDAEMIPETHAPELRRFAW
jgi:hypothetical protein